MQGQYDKQYFIEFLKDEEAKKIAEAQDKNNSEMKSFKSQAEKAQHGAQLAFEQTQTNRFEIDSLKKQVKRLRITSLIAILIALISIAMTITEELALMTSVLP